MYVIYRIEFEPDVPIDERWDYLAITKQLRHVIQASNMAPSGDRVIGYTVKAVLVPVKE